VLKDNTFCGENEFAGDVQIDGDLNVDGEITGNIVVSPPNQAQIPCNEIAVVLDATPGDQVVDWSPTGYTDQITTLVITSAAPNNVSLSGIVPLGQCYLNLINVSGQTIRLMDEGNPANTSQPENRFIINATTIQPINTNEAVTIYYCHTVDRWCLLSHL
jgi:hypothetical protein